MAPKVLVLDLYNLLHRARGGFQGGPAPVVFNFFRSLRALVQQFEATRVVAVDEGEPLAKIRLMPEYKGNRVIPDWDKAKQEEMRRFREQKDVCIDLLKRRFPISVIRHPEYEADDLLATIVHRASEAIPHIVVSTDSDFIQLLGPDYIKLYNPVKKQFVQAPVYDYAVWKSLRGDVSDNIDAVLEGSQKVKDEEAESIVNSESKLAAIFTDKRKATKFARNMQMIVLDDIPEDELIRMESSSPTEDWDEVKGMFDGYGFKSITKEETWKKFTATFDALWVR